MLSSNQNEVVHRKGNSNVIFTLSHFKIIGYWLLAQIDMDWKWTMNMSVGVTKLRGGCVWPGGGGVTTIINTLTAQLSSP